MWSSCCVAAAFCAPVGGVLFALEEAASWWRSALLWRTFSTTTVVAVVLSSSIQYCRSGRCGLFGQGGLIMLTKNRKPIYTIEDTKKTLKLKQAAYIHTDAIVVIIKAQPPRPTRTGQVVTEYVCLDHEFNEIIITLWNEEGVTERTHSLLVDMNPVVALINFKVNSFHGLSLSSSTNSFVITKMDHPDLMKMEQWRTEHMHEIQENVTVGGSSMEKIDAASNVNLPELSISEILKAESKQKYIITVQSKLKVILADFTYICCETCHRRTEYPCRNLFKCYSPQCNGIPSIRRYRFCIQVKYSSGELGVTLFGKFGEIMLGLDEDEFHKRFYPV